MSFFHLSASELIYIMVDKESVNASLLFEGREKVLVWTFAHGFATRNARAPASDYCLSG